MFRPCRRTPRCPSRRSRPRAGSCTAGHGSTTTDGCGTTRTRASSHTWARSAGTTTWPPVIWSASAPSFSTRWIDASGQLSRQSVGSVVPFSTTRARLREVTTNSSCEPVTHAKRGPCCSMARNSLIFLVSSRSGFARSAPTGGFSPTPSTPPATRCTRCVTEIWRRCVTFRTPLPARTTPARGAPTRARSSTRCTTRSTDRTRSGGTRWARRPPTTSWFSPRTTGSSSSPCGPAAAGGTCSWRAPTATPARPG